MLRIRTFKAPPEVYSGIEHELREVFQLYERHGVDRFAEWVSMPQAKATLPAGVFAGSYGTSLVITLDRPDPDIAEPDRVAMILKQDRPFGTMRPVMGKRTVRHRAEQCRVVVHDNAVVQYCCISGRFERTVLLELRGGE